MSASVKAQATKEANLALVADLLPLPYDVQATRVMALRPITRVGQVGKQLAKALLSNIKYTDKTPEEQAAFKASLPDFLKHYVEVALKGGIPMSGTRKKSHSPPAAANSPRASAEGEPSELDKRLKVFRQKGLRFSLLFLLTGEDEYEADEQNYGKFPIIAKKNLMS